jgi:hypothetical protein
MVFGLYSGTTLDNIYLYSPGGGCIMIASQCPIKLREPVFVLLMNQIYICSGLDSINGNATIKKCWIYDINANQWLARASSRFPQAINLGIVYQNKLYILNDIMGNSEVYDPLTDSWNAWNTSSLHSIGISACHVLWQDVVIIFGGSLSPYNVQMYNFTTNQWSDLSPMTDPHSKFGCIILPQNKNQVLLLSSLNDSKRADIYDIANETMIRVSNSNNPHQDGRLVAIGQRVFAIGGIQSGIAAEEYIYETDTWSNVEATLFIGPIYSSALSIPAALFNHRAFGCVGLVN